MVAFPDPTANDGPENPIVETIRFSTLTSDFENDSESSKQKSLFPKRDFPLKYSIITKDNARTVWQFFIDRKGRHEPFNLFLPFSDTYVGEYVGTTDGFQKIWNLPSKLAASYTLKLAGATLTENTHYIFTTIGGADGADKVELIGKITAEVGATGNGTATVFDYTLAQTNIKPSTLTVHYTIGATAYDGTDDGAGNITGTNITIGTINYTTGAISLTFTTAPDNAADITNDYTYYAPPAVGQYLTFDFTGRLKVRCKFNEDMMSFETFYNRLVNFGIKLKGLLNA